MKTIRNIILVILFGGLILFGLYIAPNYKKDGNEDVRNLVINYTNVTGRMKGKIIIEDDGTIYLAKEDIENYYDKYIYYDEQYNYIVATANGKTACFDINKGTLSINGSEVNSKIIKDDDMYYIPISKLQSIYNINVKYISEHDTVIIDSLDTKLETAKLNKKINVRYKATEFSKSLEKLNSDTKVAIVPDTESVKGWTLIKTENGNIGYVKNECLKDKKIEREVPKKDNKKISLVWEFFSKMGKAPKNDENVKYEGVNVVSPAFFYLEDGKIVENMGKEGLNYINWAKSNNYEIWAMVKRDNDSKEKRDEFSEMMGDYKKRAILIEQIVNYSKNYNLEGINIDFENIYKADKDNLSRFIIELKPQLENIGVTLSVDVTEPDGSDNWSLCFDRNVIGDVADYIVFMAYDQTGGSSKKAGSTAAYYWVEKNLEKFINQEDVDSSKIILGVPFYTRLWKENGDDVTSTVISMKNTNKYINSKNDIQWLEDAKQNYIEYTKNNSTYKMWIEDSASITQKLNLIDKYKLAGAAFWQKGFEDESIWNIIKEKIME